VAEASNESDAVRLSEIERVLWETAKELNGVKQERDALVAQVPTQPSTRFMM